MITAVLFFTSFSLLLADKKAGELPAVSSLSKSVPILVQNKLGTVNIREAPTSTELSGTIGQINAPTKNPSVCDMFLPGPYYYWTGWLTGEEIYATWQDPESFSCTNVYPFQINAVQIILYTNQAVTLDLQPQIYDNGGTPACPIPGSLISACPTPTYTVNIPSAGGWTITLPETCCVYNDYFAAVNILTGGLLNIVHPVTQQTGAVPCHSYDNYGSGWVDMQGAGFTGKLALSSYGMTSDQNDCPPLSAEPFLRVCDWLNPEPWHNWIGDPDDTTHIQLQIVDPNNQIQSVDFYYSIDGGYIWNFLQTDTNGYAPLRNTTTPVDPHGDGWSAYLPHSLLPIEILSLQLKSIAHMGTESLEVRNQTTYDPTPPASITLNIHDGQGIPSETVYIDVNPIRADIENIVCYIEEKADTFFKGIPKIKQPTGTTCAPTAAAACLKYFEAQGDTHIAGGLNDQGLVNALAGRMGTNGGTTDPNWANGLRSWINDHCHGYTVRGPLKFDWKEARDELERCQDVLMGITWDGGGGHAMTLNSIVNPPLPNGNIKVDFMDPWTGKIEWGEMNPNTGHVSGFTGAGASGTLDAAIIVCPKEPDPGGGGPGPPQGGGPGPNPPPIPIPLPHPGWWWVHVVVIDQTGHAHREIRVVCHPLLGDANGDGVIDIADVVYLLNYLFVGGPAPVPCLEAGDATCDGIVDVSDIVYLLNYLFVHGPAPGC
jgi:hypothetical protein